MRFRQPIAGITSAILWDATIFVQFRAGKINFKFILRNDFRIFRIL